MTPKGRYVCATQTSGVRNLPNFHSIAFFALLFSLGLSLLGLPYLRYAIYASPFLLALIWMLAPPRVLWVDRSITPFIFFLALVVAGSYSLSVPAFKTSYFVLVYVFPFILFRNSLSHAEMLWLNAVIVAAFAFSAFLGYGVKNPQGFILSIGESKSSFESTLSFPLSLMAVYWLLCKKYSLSALNVVLAILSLKRIALAATAAVFLIWLLPPRFRAVILNPVLMAVAVVLWVFVSIEIASGRWDHLFFHYLSISPDALLLGRQEGWAAYLDAMAYSSWEFVFWGRGSGSVWLLHNDLLAIVLQYGWLALISFVVLLAWQSSQAQRAVVVWLLVVLLTDNVLIYQHVMIPFLFVVRTLQSRIGSN